MTETLKNLGVLGDLAVNHPRLIEVAFPLKQTSLDSVHEKNVRHGHISTLHIWPARRPLAACRAALIASLLPDPGNAEERKKLLERLAGRVVEVVKKKKLPSGRVEEKKVEETVGGILHWGRESGPDLEWFRQRIREAYGGRAPKVLDPFAGGGAIPLEAMRLGCEVTAIDINPVAWFILKCTLEYPQKLAGQYRPLPRFALESPEFMEGFFKGTGKLTKKQLERNLQAVQANLFPPPDVDLAWHVRAWGWWVLQRAKADLERFYPVMDGKPTVAYLWARTVTCKNCRATVPLLKTRWLCKKDNKRVLLMMEPKADGTGVGFGVQTDVPMVGGNSAQRREHDKRIGRGTMTASGVSCPGCCAPDTVSMTLDDIQFESKAGRSGAELVCVVVDGPYGKEYRQPSEEELRSVGCIQQTLQDQLAEVPYGRPTEPINPARPSPNARGLSGLTRYGLDRFDKLFNDRQLLTLLTFTKVTRNLRSVLESSNYPANWIEAIEVYLSVAINRLADRNSSICHWDMGRETISNTFQRYALRINWDYCEVNPFADTTGSYVSAVEWIVLVIEHVMHAISQAALPAVYCDSAAGARQLVSDIILTDPPYYDAIPYSDLSDFFYVWLRRTAGDLYPELFAAPLTIKDEELIQHAGRMDGDNLLARQFYESGMARAFLAAKEHLADDGRFIGSAAKVTLCL